MRRYVLVRTLSIVPTLVGVSVAVFLMIRLIPGTVVEQLIGTEGTYSEETMRALRAFFGLDQPIHVQYARWLAGDEPGALAAYATLARAGNRELATRAVEKARSLYRSRTGTMGRLLLTLGPLFAASLRSGRLRLPPPRSGADGGTPAAPR